MQAARVSATTVAALVLPLVLPFGACVLDDGYCDAYWDCPTPQGPCRQPACNDGVCVAQYAPVGTSCAGSDGLLCDENGDCVDCIQPLDCPARPCFDATCDSRTCVYSPGDEGEPCGDSGGCVTGTCHDGTCNEAALPDGTACDAQTGDCQEGVCSAGACAVVDMPDGTECSLPTSECQLASCSVGQCALKDLADGSECGTGGPSPNCPIPRACSTGVCADSISCDAYGAPHGNNHTQQTAFDLGDVTDCDEGDICDALTAGETDWFVYHGIDSSCMIDAVPAFSGLTVCQYWACNDPALDVEMCPPDTVEATAPNGAFGCCGNQTWGQTTCRGSVFDSGSATVWLSITNPAATTCTEYGVHYEF